LIVLWIVIPHLAGRRFHVGWSEVGECRQKYIRVNIVRSLTEWGENRAIQEDAVEEDAIRGVPGKTDARQEDAIRGVHGNSPEGMLAVHIFILDARSSLWCMKRQVHRIRRILHAPNSRMLALVSTSAIDARIGGWFKPTYLELNKTHLKNSRHWHRCITN